MGDGAILNDQRKNTSSSPAMRPGLSPHESPSLRNAKQTEATMHCSTIKGITHLQPRQCGPDFPPTKVQARSSSICAQAPLGTAASPNTCVPWEGPPSSTSTPKLMVTPWTSRAPTSQPSSFKSPPSRDASASSLQFRARPGHPPVWSLSQGGSIIPCRFATPIDRLAYREQTGRSRHKSSPPTLWPTSRPMQCALAVEYQLVQAI